MAQNKAHSEDNADTLALAENLRVTIGTFVRRVKSEADTPTTTQSETLSLLDRNGPLSVAELANRRSVRHQSMRLVAAQLERDGLVGKLPNPSDGRSRLLSITDKGRETLSGDRAARTSKIAALLGERLSDRDRRVLREAILIINALSKPD